MLNYRLEPLGVVEGFTAEVGASGCFCPSHLTLPVDVSFYSVSDDNAPSPYMVRVFPHIFNHLFRFPCSAFRTVFLRMSVCLYANSIFKAIPYILTGCDKPGVSREKRLPCTSIRNHSSGEGTFLLYF